MEKNEIHEIVNVVSGDVKVYTPFCPSCGSGVIFEDDSNKTICKQCGSQVILVRTNTGCYPDTVSKTGTAETVDKKDDEKIVERETHEIVAKKEPGSEYVFYWYAVMFATAGLVIAALSLGSDMIIDKLTNGMKNFESLTRIPVEEIALKAPIVGFGAAAVFMVLGRICKALGLDLSDEDETEDEEKEKITKEVESPSQKTLNMGR